MLDERKIRLMKDLAVYESGEGAEELRICEYYRSDYVSVNCISGGIWVTVGYLLLLGLIGLCTMDYFMDRFTMQAVALIVVGVIAGYVGLIVLYTVTMHVYYGRKYDKAREGARHYKYRLMKLGEMYKKGEKSNG